MNRPGRRPLDGRPIWTSQNVQMASPPLVVGGTDPEDNVNVISVTIAKVDCSLHRECKLIKTHGETEFIWLQQNITQHGFKTKCLEPLQQ